MLGTRTGQRACSAATDGPTWTSKASSLAESRRFDLTPDHHHHHSRPRKRWIDQFLRSWLLADLLTEALIAWANTSPTPSACSGKTWL